MEAEFNRRWECFCALKKHPLRCTEMGRFTRGEWDAAREIITAHIQLPIGEYAQALNRVTIADPRVRTSNRTRLWGCLLEAATAQVFEEKNNRRKAKENL